MTVVVRKPGFRIGPSYEARFSPSGDRLATLGRDIVIWDVVGRRRRSRAHPFSHPSHLDFSPDGAWVAVKNTSGEVVVLDSGSLDVLARLDGQQWGEGSEVVFSPCGRYLVDGSWNGDLLVRDALSGRVEWHVRGGMVTRVFATADRSVWAHDGFGGVTIRRWPFTEASTTYWSPNTTVGSGGGAFAVNPAATHMAIKTWDGVEVWDLRCDPSDPPKVSTVKPMPRGGTGESVAWSPAGERVAVAGAGAVRVFTAELDQVAEIPLDLSCAVEFAPQGNLLACGAWSKGFVLPAQSL